MMKLGRSDSCEAFFVPEFIDLSFTQDMPGGTARLPNVNLRKSLLLIAIAISHVKNPHPDT
jgi:hypothetical protein